MPFLILVSFIWAFSFGLIKGRLAGLDSGFISAARLGLALLVFLPFLRLRGVTSRIAILLLAIGAVQFGVMYLAYNASFRYLKAYEVAILTLTTPILVTLLADALERRFHARALYAALLAVAGGLVITLKSGGIRPALAGLVLVQISNAAFALGQVLYRRVRLSHRDVLDRDVFALLYLGAFMITLPVALAQTDFGSFSVTTNQFWTLIYLGVLASGVGFFLWNSGAARVSTGTLAVMNNLKIPLAVACSMIFFGERASGEDLARLVFGGVAMALAVWMAERN